MDITDVGNCKAIVTENVVMKTIEDNVNDKLK